MAGKTTSTPEEPTVNAEGSEPVVPEAPVDTPPIDGQPATDPSTVPVTEPEAGVGTEDHEYHDVAPGVKGRVMTDEEREARIAAAS